MLIKVVGCVIRVDGIQFGKTYSSHQIACHQAAKIQQQYYPKYKLEIVPETIPALPVKADKTAQTEAQYVTA